jgi:hypothetical protein
MGSEDISLAISTAASAPSDIVDGAAKTPVKILASTMTTIATGTMIEIRRLVTSPFPILSCDFHCPARAPV